MVGLVHQHHGWIGSTGGARLYQDILYTLLYYASDKGKGSYIKRLETDLYKHHTVNCISVMECFCLFHVYLHFSATETLFRMAVSRGYISGITHGEVYIFAAGLATLLYFFRSKNNTDSIFRVFRLGLGPYEEKGYQQRNHSQAAQPTSSYAKNDTNRRKKPSNSILKLVWEVLRVYKQLIDKVKTLGGKHSSCPHPNSCVHYVLSGGLKMFSIGCSIQIGLKLVFQMKNLIRKPKQFKEILFKKGTLNLACFLGGFAGLYKFVSCSLRRAWNKDSPEHALIAGLIASTSFLMYRDNTIALYVAWKAAQLLWNDGVEKGKVPEVKWFVIFLYCFSTAVLFHAAIVEPQNLRISYWKFLYNLSGGRIAAMSRVPIDEFGLESNKHLQAILKISKTHDQHVYTF
ncbi:transmembrane protein 135 isoform X2 [Nasonia vitripennis]|uniref:Transmembrane protein 135 N-terminal domain-containing protein n=1 Tax=Nasonia vitripennis TaxID=7425 RepID=A0A7M7H9R2_NASVI|nr:transmembrane protein 135 isoform X2 [Nasonia vitripennis]